MMAYSVIAQDEEFLRDMEEYTELASQVEIAESYPAPDPSDSANPDVTIAPLTKSTENPISPPYDVLPAERYWTTVKQTESNPENGPGTIIVIIPGAEDEPGSQGSTASEQTQETGNEDAGGQRGKPSPPYETALPSASTPQPAFTPVPATTIPLVETVQPTVTPAPTPRIGKTGIDLDACKAQNSDFVAWLKIPGTKINYPVVWTDNVDYYLTHTFSGKESKIGTLFSLGKTDYKSPGRNIAIYGHHITTSGGNMFQPLMSYKKQSFWDSHKTIYLDTLYHLGEYTVFAVINMRNGEWDPAAASFGGGQAFLDFARRAKAQALYETGVEVHADDHIITLITCDRDYHNPDGRLIVMAVEQ